MSKGANELLADALCALNYMRRQALSRSRSDGNSYDLAGHIDDYFREHGIQSHTPGWRDRVKALDEVADSEGDGNRIFNAIGVVVEDFSAREARS